MKKQQNLTRTTLWINRLIALVIAALMVALQPIMDWYCTFRVLTQEEQTAITIAFYCCSAVIFFALWNMDRLLAAILEEKVFITENVRRIRRIQWCCGIVSLICVPAAFVYIPVSYTHLTLPTMAVV